MSSEVQAAIEKVIRQRMPGCRVAGMDECELATMLAAAIDAGLTKALELPQQKVVSIAPDCTWQAEA